VPREGLAECGIGNGGSHEAGGADIKHHWNRFIGTLDRTAGPGARMSPRGTATFCGVVLKLSGR